MRPATLAINLGFLFASFALGVATGRNEQGRSAPSLERQPVAGSSKSSSPEEKPEAAPPGAPAQSKSAPVPAKEPLTWGQVAARAQGWTAAVRADQNYGAGVVIDRGGLVLTNLHVVEGTRAITVTPFGVDPSTAQVVDTDSELDVALLRLPHPMENAADFAAAGALAVGDEVLAVGSPRKMYFSVSRGMVSFPNRFLDGVEYIQTDLPINVGNSGGPLVDREGHVVGLVSFILRDSQGISFALPIDRALSRFAKHLPGHAAAAADTAAGAAPQPEAEKKSGERKTPKDAAGRKAPSEDASGRKTPSDASGRKST